MANNFSQDGNCVALWRFEGAGTEFRSDSQGTNDLGGTGPSADATNFKEGAQSAWFEGTDTFSISDASLSADFPFKYGTSNKTVSFCFWIRPTELPAVSGYKAIFAKWYTASKRSILITLYNDAGNTRLRLHIGYNNGASGETHDDTTVAFVASQWYHVGVTFQDSDGAYKLRIYDETAGTTTQTAGNFVNNIFIVDTDFVIGRWYYSSSSQYLDGNIDEVVVFNDILTANEIDQVRQGIYTGGAGGSAIKELAWDFTTGSTLYACRFTEEGNVFLTNGSASEVWGTGGRTANDYDVTMTETAAGSRHYIGQFDADGSIRSGVYHVVGYEQAGASPANTDEVIFNGTIYWDGSAELDMSSLYTKIDEDVIGPDGDTLSDLSDQMDVLSAQASQVLNVYGPGE